MSERTFHECHWDICGAKPQPGSAFCAAHKHLRCALEPACMNSVDWENKRKYCSHHKHLEKDESTTKAATTAACDKCGCTDEKAKTFCQCECALCHDPCGNEDCDPCALVRVIVEETRKMGAASKSTTTVKSAQQARAAQGAALEAARREGAKQEATTPKPDEQKKRVIRHPVVLATGDWRPETPRRVVVEAPLEELNSKKLKGNKYDQAYQRNAASVVRGILQDPDFNELRLSDYAVVQTRDGHQRGHAITALLKGDGSLAPNWKIVKADASMAYLGGLAPQPMVSYLTRAEIDAHAATEEKSATDDSKLAGSRGVQPPRCQVHTYEDGDVDQVCGKSVAEGAACCTEHQQHLFASRGGVKLKRKGKGKSVKNKNKKRKADGPKSDKATKQKNARKDKESRLAFAAAGNKVVTFEQEI